MREGLDLPPRSSCADGASAIASTSNSSLARWRSSAAPTSPRNSGCGSVGARAQLGVRLRRDVVRVHVARQLDVLDEVDGRAMMPEKTRPALGDPVAVAVVHLVAVAVALPDAAPRRRPRRRSSPSASSAGYRPRRIVPPRSPRVEDVDLLRHRRDDGVLGVGVELARRRALDAGDVARVLDDHALQAEADAERRDALLAREAAARRACPRCRGCRSRRASRCRRASARRLAAPSGVSHSSDGIQRDVDRASPARTRRP